MWMLFSILMACRPKFPVTITKPADVSIPPKITKIAVVDRVGNDSSREAIGGFLELSQSVRNVRFQIIDGQQIFNDLAVPVNGPIPSDGLKEMCGKAGVQGVLVLHRFRVEDDMRTSEEYHAKTAERDAYSTYTVSYTADVYGDWRFFGCNGDPYDSFASHNNATWTAEGISPGDAKSNLGDKTDLIVTLADELGTQYFRRVSPSEYTSWRTGFRGPMGPKGKRFREGSKAMKAGQWSQAKKIYVDNMDGFSNKVEGKAHYNLALINEQLGEVDKMQTQAQKADALLQNRKSSSLLEIANQRKSDENRLKEQMQEAQEVNSQDNQ